MSDYLDFLLEDIEKCTKQAENFFAERGFNINGQALNHQKYMEGEKISFDTFFPISKDDLPEASKLSRPELEVVTYKLEKLLNAYHFFFDFPVLLPLKEKYNLIRTEWRKEVKLALSGETHLEFCYSTPKQCPFDKYCTICDDLKD